MLNILKTSDEILQAAAEYFVKIAEESISRQGRFTVALSGGNSPKGLHQLLASDVFRSKIEWTKVFFFFGDERYVPADHPDSNYLMAKKTLFEPLNISDEQIFAYNTSLSPTEAAEEYQKKLESFFANSQAKFDLIILGLGDNSHTASLFPHTDVINELKPGIKAVYLEDKQMYRLTFTAPLINLARHIAFLVFGSGKAEAVRHVLKDKKDYNEYPAQLIEPVDGDLVWFMDEAAAALLNS